MSIFLCYQRAFNYTIFKISVDNYVKKCKLLDKFQQTNIKNYSKILLGILKSTDLLGSAFFS